MVLFGAELCDVEDDGFAGGFCFRGDGYGGFKLCDGCWGEDDGGVWVGLSAS